MSDTGRPDVAAEPSGGSSGLPRWVLPVAIGVGALIVVAVLVVVLVNRGGDDQPAPATSTVVEAPPTPAVEPAQREATTAFASALPTSVLQYALAASQEDAEWVGAGALEAYTETFTDGADGTVTVRAGQLETPEEAAAFLARLTEGLGAAPSDAPTEEATPADGDEAPALPQSGDVTVGDQVVGTFTVVDAGDGTGVAVWQNGTGVFHLTAPVGEVLDAYAAFGL